MLKGVSKEEIQGWIVPEEDVADLLIQNDLIDGYRYKLGVENKYVENKLNSGQFKYSEIILDKRLGLGLSVEKMAQALNLSVNEYATLEFCDVNTPIENYESALIRIKEVESLK